MHAIPHGNRCGLQSYIQSLQFYTFRVLQNIVQMLPISDNMILQGLWKGLQFETANE